MKLLFLFFFNVFYVCLCVQAPVVGAVSAPASTGATEQVLGFPVVSGTRITGDGARIRFVMDLSTEVSYHIFVLPAPYRIVIDLPALAFDLPDGIGALGRGLVSQYRYGTLGQGQSRVVLDLNTPARVRKSFIIPKGPKTPARLVVDLEKVDEKTFLQAYAPSVPTPRPPPTRPLSSPPLFESKKPEKGEKKIIVLDPGHGGIDPGASSKDGVLEKNIVLKMAKTIKKHLEKEGGYTVYLTRSDDTFLSLAERVRRARKWQADLLIALHADMLATNKNVRGATVYTLSEKASDQEAARLAHAENRSDIIAGVDLEEIDDKIGTILIDLIQRETKNNAILLAQSVVTSLKGVTPLTKHPRRSAGFRVLKAPDVPSILLELGYLSNPKDRALLLSTAWMGKVSTALVKGLNRYFLRPEKEATGPLAPVP